jgi:hypothetical protein
MLRVDRFKHGGPGVDKMLKATLYIQRTDGRGPSSDDTIQIFEDETHHDMARVVYSTPELAKNAEFYLPTSKAILYIRDTLKTLRHDTQPFESVQVTTRIHPSVLYHVSDLDDYEVRHLIEDTIETAIRLPVFRTSKH